MMTGVTATTFPTHQPYFCDTLVFPDAAVGWSWPGRDPELKPKIKKGVPCDFSLKLEPPAGGDVQP